MWYNINIEINKYRWTMKINYSYKFKLYPTKTQETLLNKHFGSNRFIYNYFLDKKIKFYEENKENEKKSLNYYDCTSQLSNLKKDLIWLKEVNSQSLQQSLKNLDNSYQNFFKFKKGFPKFHSKHNKESFKIPQFVQIRNNKIKIPKFKEGIKYDRHREIEGDIKSCTISKSKSGKFYISILVEKEIQEKPKLISKIGIDLGIKNFVTFSNGLKINSPDFYRKLESKLKKLNRKHSKKINGSNNKNKLRIKIAKINEKIVNQRNDFLHKLSSKIINENQVICLEDLQIKNMIKNRKLSKSIQDCSWSKFVRMLMYKGSWNGREVIKIGKFYPSSKTCSNCGSIHKELKLKDRKWTCNDCGFNHDRDLNAAKNILKQGLNNIPKGLRELKLVENPTMEKTFNNVFSSDSMKQEVSTLKLE